MKLVIIIGPGAVGKMTVGQELAEITDLKLLHNHTFMEPIHNFFDVFVSAEGQRLNTLFKQEIFEAVVNSDLPGLIYTSAMPFNKPSTVEYIKSLIKLFESKNAFVCVVELYADFDIRLERNKTENRLLNKPSKRKMGIQRQEEHLRKMEVMYRYKANDDEILQLHKNYLKIDNTNLPPAEAALKIKEVFVL
jgi:shikimate kinase